MKREQPGAILSTVFVDYDNIYLSLKRKSEEAAKRFAKDAPLWLGELVRGRLITPTNGPNLDIPRRIVMNRCYGNPVPRRNSNDNSTDMNSFPFVRHHFLRAGFEVVDCPPLTAQLKNSSDIRMVMDVRDYLNHDTYFDEFIILSGDADFTPLLHRLRAHARRTVIFANDYTAAPYTAISDGEVRESDLIAVLLEGRTRGEAEDNAAISAQAALPASADLEQVRRDIIKEVITAVRSAGQPVPLEALADRAVRNIGHERTVGTGWGGIGSFRDLLLKGLPEDLALNEQPPYFVFDASRQIAQPTESAPALMQSRAPEARIEPRLEATAVPRSEPAASPRIEIRTRRPVVEQREQIEVRREPRLEPPIEKRAEPLTPQQQPGGIPHSLPERQTQAAAYLNPPVPQHASESRQQQPARTPERAAAAPAPSQRPAAQLPAQTRTPAQPATAAQANDSGATAIQRSIARIHEACQAPPLSPPEYRSLFDVMALEINENGLNGQQTLTNIARRAAEVGVDTRRDDVRFVLDVISETDPWFDQGASSKLFAGRFRNFVVARCRSQGLTLSADELDLIDAWFAGTPAPQQRAPERTQQAYQQVQATGTEGAALGGERWWNAQAQTPQANAQQGTPTTPAGRFGSGEELGGDEFPRIVRRGSIVR